MTRGNKEKSPKNISSKKTKTEKTIKQIKKKEEYHLDDREIKVSQARVLKQKHEREKLVLMWVGISFFMILVFVFWVYNFKKSINSIQGSDYSFETSSDWESLTKELSGAMADIKTNIESLKSFSSSTEPSVETSERTTPLFQNASTTKMLEDLKEDLEEKYEEKQAPFFVMNDEEKVNFLEKIDVLVEGVSVEDVIAQVGEANYDQTIRDSRANFISRDLSYYLLMKYEKDTSKSDSFIILEFDSENKLKNINKANLK